MKSIAIIPARSGSKGLKDKNIKNLCGKPLMAYSIIAAKESGVFDEIMVSTDSEQYADIARQWGASVPFLRSQETSTDTASSWAMVKEVLNRYNKRGQQFEAFCLLQPTSPLRTANDIVFAYNKLKECQTAVISVCEVDHSPLWCNTLPSDLSLDGFIYRQNIIQRQKMAKYYRVNGAIYFVRTTAFIQDDFLYRDGSTAFVMKKEHSIDIDDEFDFIMAKIFMETSYEKSRG